MKRALTILSLVCVASLSAAQFDMSGLALTRCSPVMAMTRADVKKELKLTRDQDKAISKIEKDFQGSVGGGGNDMASLMNGMGTLGKANEASEQIVGLLDDGQKKRLFEIRVQMMGPPGFMDPDVARLLELNDSQKQQVKAVESSYWEEWMHLVQTDRGRGLEGKVKKMRAESDQKELDLLTEPQKAKYKEMQGATFKDARPKTGF